MSTRLTIFCDGAVQPANPGGLGCCAFVVFEGDGSNQTDPVYDKTGTIGRHPGMTNNEAEHRAVLAALKWCEKYAAHLDVTIYTDSQLVERQVNGHWECNATHLIKFRDDSQGLLFDKLPKLELKWTRRENNTVADGLTRMAYQRLHDEGIGYADVKRVFECLLSKRDRADFLTRIQAKESA